MLHAIRISRAPMTGLGTLGFLWGGFAGCIPDLKAQVDASEGALGAALLCTALGSITSIYLAPKIAERLGRRALPILGPCVALAVLLPLLAYDVRALAVAFFFMGAVASLLDITSNVRISLLESRHRLHLMNVNHANYSACFAVSAFATGLLRHAGYGPHEILPVLSVLVVLASPLMWEGTGRLGPASGGDGTAPGLPLPWLAVLLAGGVLFAAMTGENAIEAWSALLIEDTLGAPAGQGSFGPFTLGLVMAIGRLSGQVVAARLGEARLIVWSAVLGTVGAVILALAPVPAVAFLGVALLGLGIAVVVPSVNSILGRAVPERIRAVAISRAWMMGMLGFFIGPAMIGGIAEISSLRWSFGAVALIVMMVIPAVLRLDAQGRPTARGGAAPEAG